MSTSERTPSSASPQGGKPKLSKEEGVSVKEEGVCASGSEQPLAWIEARTKEVVVAEGSLSASPQRRKPSKEQSAEGVCNKEEGVSASGSEQALAGTEGRTGEQIVVAQGQEECQSEPAAKRARLMEPGEAVMGSEPSSPESDSFDITPEEESLMLQALLAYEEEEKASHGQPKKS